MAIDSLRKRASIASLGLAFLGPSVVPDSTLGVFDRQTIAHSYYGIDSSVVGVTIGDTSQIGSFDATGGITLERTIGGTSQLLAFDSTGGLTLERTIGGTAQLVAFTSTGGINAGTGTTTKGGYVPPIYKKTKLKKKDESIRDEINALLTEVKETTAFVPLKVETGLREVYDKAPEIINLKESTRRTQQLAALSVEVNELRKTLKRTIKEAQEDEETAIQALLEIM